MKNESLHCCPQAAQDDAINRYSTEEGECKSLEAPQPASQESGIEPLFTAVLQYQQESQTDPVIAGERHEGAYIGGGDGIVAGKRLHGMIRWSLWAGNCVYPLVRTGQSVPEGVHLCTMNPSGFIETDDGARIRFDGRGYGLRGSGEYRTSLTLVFGAEDARYAWLTTVLGVMEGEFDEKTGRAIWNVYVPARVSMTAF